MDLKPIVTNFGDEKLYVYLSKEIERRLPSKSVNWKRTYGRTSKTVCLKASFTKFNSDQLGATSDGTVSKQPFLHLYWTSCMENDEFRHGIKQKIINWQDNLKSRDISDWLIIQVVTQDSHKSTRSKITLPRSSVFDKIKNDLCGKNGARVAQLWEPAKETLFTKSGESWEALLSQLRQLLLDSISRHLTKFEEKVRHQRERYAESSWSFIEYLKLNEELATIFKSVTLHEDALVQYDELDALFSQFVVNGKIKGIPPWMEQFTKTPTSWDGITLQKQAIQYYRDVVYEGRATLLELRNYIFIRQWQMLIKVNRGWDVAHRLLEFLFTVVNEIKILLTGLSICVPACWVAASCLEYINFVEEKEIGNNTVMSCLAQILDYTREKLFFVAKECQILPGQQPIEDIVSELSKGLCKNSTSKDGIESGSKLLLKAVTSQSNFNKLYLKICGRTKTLYQNVRRYRFANRVGVDIAKFYMMKEKYESAEKQLTNALHEYRESKWRSLHIDVLEPLATCQAKLNSFDRYLCSLAALSCADTLSVEKRSSYADMFLHSAHKEADHFHTIGTEPVISLEQVSIDLTKEIGHVGEIVNVCLSIRNNLLKEIRMDDIEIRMRYTETDQVRLSDVDSGLNSLQRNTNEMNWSELFNRPDEQSSPASPKSTIFKRIYSRRITKQKETRDNVEDIAANDGADGVAGSEIANEDAFKRGSLNKILDAMVPEEVYLDETKPKTLAEIASDLPRTMSIGDESADSKSNSSLEPITIANGGINCRCDSSASSLSVVSISSEKDSSFVDSMLANNKLETNQKLLLQQKLISPLYGSTNVTLEGNLDTNKEDSVASFTDAGGITEDISTEAQIEDEASLGDDNPDQDVVDADIYSNDKVNEIEATLDDKENNDNEESESVCGKDLASHLKKKLETGLNSLSDEISDCIEDERSDSGLEMRESEKDDVFADGFEGAVDIEEIEEDIEEELAPTRSLVSGNVLLGVGENVVKLTAKVMHVGRYNLQTLKCKIGNVFLFKVLDLPRKSRAFFIVSDPPTFCWTSDHLSECLLLGNKQRIHVTLSNGPGFIPASSVVQLSSSTGLEFSNVPPSSVMVYSPNQKDDPKEGVMQIEMDSSKKNEANMYLPDCGPYEMSDVYFDVTAPAENADSFGHMAKHEITLNCLWLSEMISAKTTLESIFYEPFNIEHEVLYSTAGQYIRTTLKNLNPVQINISNPELRCLNSEHVLFSCVPCDIQMSIHANEELCLIWHIDNTNQDLEAPHVLICRLKVNFRTENQDDLGGFSKQFEVSNNRNLFAVTTSMLSKNEKTVYKDSTCSVEVTVRAIGKLPLNYHYGKIYCKIADNDEWRFEDNVDCRKYELHAETNLNFKFTTNAVPCVAGKLRHPRIILSRLLENNCNSSKEESAMSRKHHMGSAVSKEGLSTSRRTSASTSDELAHAFENGEVLYTESAKFIDVLHPPKQETAV